MNKLNKNTVETIKTIVIAVLLTAIIAFIAGAKYQAHTNAQTQRAVQTAVASKN